MVVNIFVWIGLFLFAFAAMEGVAWFNHKYIMHGILWSLHRDHHKKDHDSWFERNDGFFLFYAVLSMGLFYFSVDYALCAPLGAGILAYGFAYFIVHDIFIHQRFKMFRNIDHWYARGIRRAHKMHHKHSGKEGSECFGMLWVPRKYFRVG